MAPERGGDPSWMRDPVSGRRFILHRTADGRLLANPDQRSGPPVVVMSIPKAGTYLLGRLLERLGLVDTELHLSDFSLTDYRGLSVEQKRGPGHVDVSMPITASAGLIGEGQFAVGHLKPEPWGRGALAGCRRIFLKRDLIDATLSHLRFYIQSDRAPLTAVWREGPPSPDQALHFLQDHGARLVRDEYEPMLGWLDHPDTLVLSFEDLSGDLGPPRQAERLEALCAHLGLEAADAVGVLQREVLGRSTKTLSDARTDAAPYWSEALRQTFVALGVEALNARLGYPPR